MVGGLTGRYGLKNAYNEYGNNKEGLIVLALFCNANDQEALAWDQEHDVPYPSISLDGFNGEDIRYQYGAGSLFGVPTVCLIAPDKKIVEKDLADETACISDPYTDSLMIILKQYPIGLNTALKDKKVLSNVSPGIRLISSSYLYLSVPEDEVLAISMYSADGKMITSFPDRFFARGEVQLSWDSRNFAKGIVLVRIESGVGAIINKIVIP